MTELALEITNGITDISIKSHCQYNIVSIYCNDNCNFLYEALEVAEGILCEDQKRKAIDIIVSIALDNVAVLSVVEASTIIEKSLILKDKVFHLMVLHSFMKRTADSSEENV